jgi:type IV secretory pathway TrbD component
MSKSTVTLAQVTTVLRMAEDKRVSQEHFQALIDSGFLSDLLGGNTNKVRRDDFRQMLGLDSLCVLTPRILHNIGPLDSTLDLDTFYKTGLGLYIWPDFVSTIVARAKVSKKKPTLTRVYSRDLTAGALDEVIEKGVGKNHYFEELEVALLIARLIRKQQRGIAGILLNKSNTTNIFYTKSCVLSVDWDSNSREWLIRMCLRDDSRWGVGCRVFSRN